MSSSSFLNNFLMSIVVLLIVLLIVLYLVLYRNNKNLMFILFALVAINAVNVYNMYYLLIAFGIFSIAYINVNNAILEKKKHDGQWKNVKYKFGIEYSDKPSEIYLNMFNDDNRANTYDT